MLGCSCNPRVTVLRLPWGAHKRHDFCKVSAGGWPGPRAGTGTGPRCPGRYPAPGPAPALLQGDTAACRGSAPCPLPSLLTVQKYIGRHRHEVPPTLPSLGTLPGESLASFLPFPTFLLTSGPFYPAVHHLCDNFCPHAGARQPGCRRVRAGCRIPLHQPGMGANPPLGPPQPRHGGY